MKSDTLRPSAGVQRLAYTVDEAAAATGISQTGIKRLIRRGKLQSTLLGGRRLIPVRALTELFDELLP